MVFICQKICWWCRRKTDHVCWLFLLGSIVVLTVPMDAVAVGRRTQQRIRSLLSLAKVENVAMDAQPVSIWTVWDDLCKNEQ